MKRHLKACMTYKEMAKAKKLAAKMQSGSKRTRENARRALHRLTAKKVCRL